MPFDVQDEIIDVRERLARIETTLASLSKRIECQPAPASSGQIVIPVAVATAIIQAVVAVAQHFT